MICDSMMYDDKIPYIPIYYINEFLFNTQIAYA